MIEVLLSFLFIFNIYRLVKVNKTLKPYKTKQIMKTLIFWILTTIICCVIVELTLGIVNVIIFTFVTGIIYGILTIQPPTKQLRN